MFYVSEGVVDRMQRRKRIGVIMAYPEAGYQQKVLDGIRRNCARYGYDVLVFTMQVQSCHFYKKALIGEKNIYELINFDRLDGVIVCAVSLSENNDYSILEYVESLIRERCTKPVVSIDMPVGDFPMAESDDALAMKEMTDHVLDVHGCRKVYVLTGGRSNTVSHRRLKGVRQSFEEHGLTLDDENVIFGDFWYTSGRTLADRIASGETERPDAVICCSDHMAMGLTSELIRKGLRVPEDICVTGFDSVSESAVNTPSITSYVPGISVAAGKAINLIREQIDPGEEILPPLSSPLNGLKICASCGCPEDSAYVKGMLSGMLLRHNHEYTDENWKADTADMQVFLDSYMFEQMTGTDTVADCLYQIANADWLLKPYRHLFLCMDPDWLDTTTVTTVGYPEQMNISLHQITADSDSTGFQRYLTPKNDHLFDTSLMLPRLDEDREEPSMFYFSPVHFNEAELGYVVFERPLSEERCIGAVFHNWMRNISNALEMIRSKNRLRVLSDHDELTGMYNRRGMYSALEDMQARTGKAKYLRVFVVDMDGLKYVNDTFGHSEGDVAIKAVAEAILRTADLGDICVRAGGDEFYLIGTASVKSAKSLEGVCSRFAETLDSVSGRLGKPYTVTASIGYACGALDSNVDILISKADVMMYERKVAARRNRE